MESGQCMEGVPDATITHELCLQSHEQITKQIKALVDDTGVQHVFVGSDVDPRLSYIRKKLGPAVSHHLITCTLLTLGAHAQRGLQYLVCKSVRLSVRYPLFCHYAQQGGQKAIPTGSVPHCLDF